jgi:hypothetical protein
MEAETTIADTTERTVEQLLAEARKLRKLCDGYEPEPVVAYANAVVDLARVSAARIEQLATRVAAAVECAEGHKALKHGSREAFDAATTPIGATDGPRAMPLGNCRRCSSTIAYVGGGS